MEQKKSFKGSRTSNISVFNSSNNSSLPSAGMGSSTSGGFGAPTPDSIPEADVLMTKLSMAHNRETRTKIYRTIRNNMRDSPSFFSSFASCILSKETGWLSITSQLVDSDVIPQEAVEVIVRLARSGDPIVRRLALSSGLSNLLEKPGMDIPELCRSVLACINVPNGYTTFSKKGGCNHVVEALEKRGMSETPPNSRTQIAGMTPHQNGYAAGDTKENNSDGNGNSNGVAASDPITDLVAILSLMSGVIDQGADDAIKQFAQLKAPIFIIKRGIGFLPTLETHSPPMKGILKLLTVFSQSLANTNWFVESALSIAAHSFPQLPLEAMAMTQEVVVRISAFDMVATHKQILPNAVAMLQRVGTYAVEQKKKKQQAEQTPEAQGGPTPDGGRSPMNSAGWNSESAGDPRSTNESPVAVSLDAGASTPQAGCHLIVPTQPLYTPMTVTNVLLRFCVFTLDKIPDELKPSLPLHAYVASTTCLKGEAISQDVAKLYVHLLVQCIRYCGIPATAPHVNYGHIQRCKDSLLTTGFDFNTFAPVLMLIQALSQRPCLGLIRFWMPFSELVRTSVVTKEQLQSITGVAYDQERQIALDQTMQVTLQKWMAEASMIADGAQQENRQDVQTLESIARAAICDQMRVDHGGILGSTREGEFRRRDLKAVHGLRRLAMRAQYRLRVFNENTMTEKDVVSILKQQCKDEKDTMTSKVEETIANTGMLDDEVAALKVQLKARKHDVSKRFRKKEGGELNRLSWVGKQGSTSLAGIATYFQETNVSTPGYKQSVFSPCGSVLHAEHSGYIERPGILGRADHDGGLGVFGVGTLNLLGLGQQQAPPQPFRPLGPFPMREIVLLQLKEEILRGIGFYKAGGGHAKLGGNILGGDYNTPNHRSPHDTEELLLSNLGPADDATATLAGGNDPNTQSDEVSLVEEEAVEWAGLQRRFKNLPGAALFEATRKQRQVLLNAELLARRVAEEEHVRRAITIWNDCKRVGFEVRRREEATTVGPLTAPSGLNLSVTVGITERPHGGFALGGSPTSAGSSTKLSDVLHQVALEQSNRERMEWSLLLNCSALCELSSEEGREVMTRQLVQQFSEQEFRSLAQTMESEERARLRYWCQLTLCVREVEHREAQDRYVLERDLSNRLDYFSDLATLLAGRPGIAFVFDLA